MKKVFKQLNTLLNRKQKKRLFLLFGGAIFVAILDTLSVSLMASFMALLMGTDGVQSGVFHTILVSFFGEISSVNLLKALSLFFVFLYLFRGVSKVTYNFWQARIISTCRAELAVDLFACVMHKPYDYHLRHNTAETQRLVTADISNMFLVVTHIMLTASAGLTSFGIIVVLFFMDWKMTIALIVIVELFIRFVQKWLKSFIRKISDMNFRASTEMHKWVSQAIGGLKNIFVKQKQNYYVHRFGVVAKGAAIAQSNAEAVNSVPKVMIDTLCMVMVFSIILVQLLIGQDITDNLPVFATFALAALRLVPVFGQITSTINMMSFYRPSIDTICEFFQEKVEKNKEKTSLIGCKDLVFQDIKDGIQLLHVSFYYDDPDKSLFTDLNLLIPAKKSVAFVGTTGSGKTTLADIILGLHKPTEGRILVDGKDIHEYPAEWANLIGYIPQFIYLSDDTIRANVALGDEEDRIDDKWVWNCLDRAKIREFVEGLPNKLDTVIGENGIRLSGGQRQRIGIARALYCKPQFLLMDEATSSLDGETEKAIVDSINSLSGNLTMLIIAHRLSTIEGCDIIYRIEKGKALLEKAKETSAELVLG